MRKYDLEERTFNFAKCVREFIYNSNEIKFLHNDQKQLIRSSGSIGANYIEANERVSDNDKVYRIKIAKKEAKESRYWLRLLETDRNLDHHNRRKLINEVREI